MYGEIFGRPYLPWLQDWSFLLYVIWRASWWYIICSYKMYITQVIKGELGLMWTRTEYIKSHMVTLGFLGFSDLLICEMLVIFIKPGSRPPQHLVSWNCSCADVCMCVCACVCVCVSAPRLLITCGMIWTPYNWLNKFYSHYMEIVVVIVNGRGLGIDTCHSH